MRIEAVVVCVNYSDFLAVTLPENLQHLDKMVIVTTPEDKATQALCTKFGVDVITTRVFFEDGDPFNKGRAINLGLSHLRHDDWLLQLDADTLLPHRFRYMLNKAKIDKTHIYGADRLSVKSFEQWQKIKNEIVPQYQYRYLVTPHDELTINSRLIHKEYGYCPIGYFQLWHKDAGRKYPINQGSAEHTDVLFAVQWDRPLRTLLPELFVFHLESEKAQMGTNWQGRKTKPFAAESKTIVPHQPKITTIPEKETTPRVQRHVHYHKLGCPVPPYFPSWLCPCLKK